MQTPLSPGAAGHVNSLSRAGTLPLMAAAVLSHTPLLFSFIDNTGSALTHMRALAAVGAIVLLLWRKGQRGRTTAYGLHTALLGGAMLLAAAAWWQPPLYIISLPLLVIGIAPRTTTAQPYEQLGVGLVAVLVFPFETHWGDVLDPISQAATADLAAALVRLSGFAVHVVHPQAADPFLAAEGLTVTVNRLCAGSQTLFTILTLGAVIAELFLEAPRIKLSYVAGALLFGFLGNVLRVALSTHAARVWGGDALSWNIAHDVIGYAAFIGVYGLLFIIARRLQGPKSNIRKWR